MPNANTQIANLNEANLHSILAAIAELRKRVADDQRAWDKLEQRRDAASALYVRALNELNQRVREYFADNQQDPGGCVSDPPSESCLDHIDEIQDAHVREDFERQLDEINSRNQSNMTAISAAQDDVRKDERAAYDDYQKTLDRLGRAFAQRAGTMTGHGGVSQVPVLFNASELLPDRLYISTLESAGLGSNYLSGAYTFHKLWGLDPIPIRSLEELLGDTIRRRSKPNRVRIVSHGTPVGLRLRMFKEGSLELDEERFETFLEGTLPLFRYLVGYAGFDERPPGRRVAAAIRRDPLAADVVSTFGLGNPTRQTAAFLFYEALLRSKAYEAPAGANAAVLEEALSAITKLLRTRLRTIYGVDAATVRKLQRAVGRAVAADTGGLNLGGLQFEELQKDDLGALVGFLAKHPSLEVRIEQFQRVLEQQQTYVDIRGCEVGSSTQILRATAKLFTTTRARVTAPHLFLGYARVERYSGVSLECKLESIMPLPALVEQASEAEGKFAHSTPWTGAQYLKNYARFLGIARLTRGWLFRPDRKTWDELVPQIQAAEVLYFMPFFVWLAETALPAGTTLPSGATTITNVQVYLDYLFDCLERDVRPALRRLLRTCWADAPAAMLETLTDKMVTAGTTTAPYLPLMDTAMIANTPGTSRLKLGQYLLTYDPAFRSGISHG